MINDDLIRRATEYAHRHQLTLARQLGRGVHGTVFVGKNQPHEGIVSAQSAIKVHRQEPDYCRERDVYLRLTLNGVNLTHGCHVPELLRCDDDLLIIEMTVVTRPYVLDFAGAFLDRAPDFSEEVLAEWRAEKLEQFGARWPKVEAIMRFLEGLDIYLVLCHT